MAHSVVLLYVQSEPPSSSQQSLQLSYADAKQVVTFTTPADNTAWAKEQLKKFAADRVAVETLQNSLFVRLTLTVNPKQPITFRELQKTLAARFVASHHEYVYSSQPLNPARVEFTIRTPRGNSPQISLRVNRGEKLFTMEALRPLMQAMMKLGLHFGGSDIHGWYFFTPPRRLPPNFRDKIVTHYAQFDSGFYKQ